MYEVLVPSRVFLVATVVQAKAMQTQPNHPQMYRVDSIDSRFLMVKPPWMMMMMMIMILPTFKWDICIYLCFIFFAKSIPGTARCAAGLDVHLPELPLPRAAPRLHPARGHSHRRRSDGCGGTL